jgi:hypothetical protein
MAVGDCVEIAAYKYGCSSFSRISSKVSIERNRERWREKVRERERKREKYK